MSDNQGEVGGVVTTKIVRVEANPLNYTFEITFRITQELLEGLGDKDEQSALYLLELLGEIMQELQAFSRGEHPRLNRTYDDQGIPLDERYGRTAQAAQFVLKLKAQMDTLIQQLKAAENWPPKKP